MRRRQESAWLSLLPLLVATEVRMDTEQDYEAELPLLGWIAGLLRWLEELIVLVSGPLLMAGLGIGLVALLSDGALLLTAPWLLYAWAISQTVGVDGQLVGSWYRVSVAIARRQWGAALAFVALGVLLAYVAYVAALVFATQQTYGLSTAQALARLGMNNTSWLWQRSGVSVLLVCLSGYLRYRAPRKQLLSLEERKRAIEDQIELDALKAKQRTQQAQGAVGLLRGMAQAARGAPSPETADRAPNMPPSARDHGPAGSAGEGNEVSAETAAPLSELLPTPSALPMAWPTVRVAQEQAATARDGRR
jgi:hypothetical protein